MTSFLVMIDKGAYPEESVISALSAEVLDGGQLVLRDVSGVVAAFGEGIWESCTRLGDKCELGLN